MQNLYQLVRYDDDYENTIALCTSLAAAKELLRELVESEEVEAEECEIVSFPANVIA